MDASEVFTCEVCEFSTAYTFYGRKPPKTRNIGLLEDCYGISDPFTPSKDKFLILGSKCSLCNKTVCVGTDCSIFYTKRFCLQCVRENLGQFPEQIQIEIEKKTTAQKS
ncbi:cysteine-rich DPF motif domain-containing protein 1 [Neoarius graeffei]|uniref:cysteine-rich DPF motif domain-containing protein 1 n=1 Tax=Neoarius graeffei TaxID=443677 RepID=UPI00298D0CFE|nr:cysteine-rich DPF motif domain-containing protein 1 [Neoarius graeffei]XP_060759215.1 cysteine-rich DPF motif domain-containing protein 1 [Neoarius graeffei]